MTGVAGVMALVLAEAVAGATALLWLTPLWNEVKRGFFKLVGVVLVALAAATWFSVDSALVDRFAGGDLFRATTIAASAATTLWTTLLFARRDTVARVVGEVSVALWLSVLSWMGTAGRQSFGLALFQLAAGAALLGATTDGLLLGHWYLTDRRLTRGPIDRTTTILGGSVAVAAVAVLSGGFTGVESSTAINPLLTAGALAPWIALGMIAATALIAVLVRIVLRGERPSAVQSATGFYYLAVVTAFTAEVAVKTRFLGEIRGPVT